MGQGRNKARQESNHIWYVGLVRHYQPSTGFVVRVMVLTPGRRWLADLDPGTVQDVGPYEAAVQLLDSVFEKVRWFETPGEIRVNDSALAERLRRISNWRGFALVNHEHEALESRRKSLQTATDPKGIAVWL